MGSRFAYLGFAALLVVAPVAAADDESVVLLESESAVSSNVGLHEAVRYFEQTFYHMSILPLLVVTLVLAILARPKIGTEVPAEYRNFQWVYLSVWSICVAADWLQGPYVFALYQAYGFPHHEIAQLFVAGFASSLIFGCLVGAVADRFGRKKSCLLYCVLYIVSCFTKHFNNYGVLMFGRITGGIATSLLFSCFECWLVAESTQRGFTGRLLGHMFGLMFAIMYCVAIASGLVAQVAADGIPMRAIHEGGALHVGGYCTPFDMAIVCLLVGSGMIAALWDENYGAEQGEENASIADNLKGALEQLRSDRRTWLVGVVVACFEGAMYAFVFNWTPALESAAVPPPYGIIFALFMMVCMCGASLSTITAEMLDPMRRVVAVCAIGMVAFVFSACFANSAHFLYLCFVAFLAFEFCCGVYFPSIGVVKSEVVPERIRGTMYNLYRVPLNLVVVALLLSNVTLIVCFSLCAGLLAVALAATVFISYSAGARIDEHCLGESTNLLPKSMLGKSAASQE